MFLAKLYDIRFADQRLAAGVDVDIGPQTLALLYDAVQFVEGQIQLIAVFRRPAAGAMKVAGAGGVHEDCPWHVALVLVLHTHGLGSADQGPIHNRSLHQLPALASVDVGPKALYQFGPVVVGIGHSPLDPLHLMGQAGAVRIKLYEIVQNLGDILLRILVQPPVQPFHGKAGHMFRCVHGVPPLVFIWLHDIGFYCFFHFTTKAVCREIRQTARCVRFWLYVVPNLSNM